MTSRSRQQQKSRPHQTRHAELVELLNERRQRVLQDVRQHLQRARDAAERQHLEDSGGDSVNASDDMGLALAQIQCEMLERIDAALARLADGRYGDCAGCGRPIPSQRLRALPFAVRCRECEEAREASPPASGSLRRWADEPGEGSLRSRRVLDTA